MTKEECQAVLEVTKEQLVGITGQNTWSGACLNAKFSLVYLPCHQWNRIRQKLVLLAKVPFSVVRTFVFRKVSREVKALVGSVKHWPLGYPRPSILGVYRLIKSLLTNP